MYSTRSILKQSQITRLGNWRLQGGANRSRYLKPGLRSGTGLPYCSKSAWRQSAEQALRQTPRRQLHLNYLAGRAWNRVQLVMKVSRSCRVPRIARGNDRLAGCPDEGPDMNVHPRFGKCGVLRSVLAAWPICYIRSSQPPKPKAEGPGNSTSALAWPATCNYTS